MMRLLAFLCAMVFAFAPAMGQAQVTANPHGTLKQQCADCHRADGWKPAKVKMSFRHAEQTFPLEGAHARATCTSCHKSLEFSQAPTTCVSCHTDVHRGELGTQCASCHNARSFVDRGTMQIRHQTGRFPLEGAHARATCESCHASSSPGKMQFVNQPTTCFGCHAADYRGAKDPDHVGGTFPQDCTSCHSLTSWSGAVVDHGATRFPLVGAHQAVGCLECHKNGVYRGTPLTCAGCHDGDYAASTRPHHTAAGFATQCESCHAVTTWSAGTYDHSKSAFPLTGAHTGATCESCHADGAYKGRPATCVACHRTQYDNVQVPPHASAGLPTTCESCHATTQWKGAAFDHAKTAFVLTGAHLAANCLDCHKNNVYKGTPATCASCHDTDYSATTNPHHAAAGFLTQCQTCHTTATWAGGNYNHAATAFPLTGAHQTAMCSSCHADRVYDGKPTTCVSCHRELYDNVQNPPHASAGLPTTCESCHATTQWKGAAFNHAATAFPLTGAHLAASCLDCHKNNVYKGTPATCASCHDTDYSATTNPHHAAAGFLTQCQTCHTTAAWQGGTYDHNTTAFPLTGAHQTATCSSCHADRVYDGKPTTCVACHQTEWNGTTNPPHQAAGFPTTCQSCHNTTQWPGATFNHSATQFPLTGAHVTTACAGCHGDGIYKGKSTLCASCHQADFNGTTTPNHISAGFPTTCATCHNTAQWLGATFDHDGPYFPIYSGAHKGRWSSCATCHTSPSNYKVFTCLTCHEHSQSLMDAKHAGRAGYSYVSTACLACHPRGTH